MKIQGHETYLTRVGVRPRLLVSVETGEGIAGWGEGTNTPGGCLHSDRVLLVYPDGWPVYV